MSRLKANALVLAIDTCGSSGSIALGRLEGDEVTPVAEAALAGGAFAAKLVQAIADLLAGAGVGLTGLAGIVAVAGPGSFTGIRIGLAAVKALAEAAELPVVAVSRLAVLAERAGTTCSVLDAYRGQIYCGIYSRNGGGETGREEDSREMLLTAGEVNAMGGLPGPVAVCEESVAQLLETLHGEPELMRVLPPTALDALVFSLPKWRAGEFADVASLDGHYLRGADAKVIARQG